jgi:hypothetical protein
LAAIFRIMGAIPLQGHTKLSSYGYIQYDIATRTLG